MSEVKPLLSVEKLKTCFELDEGTYKAAVEYSNTSKAVGEASAHDQSTCIGEHVKSERPRNVRCARRREALLDIGDSNIGD